MMRLWLGDREKADKGGAAERNSMRDRRRGLNPYKKEGEMTLTFIRLPCPKD